MSTKQFGGKISKHWKEKYETSSNWRDGSFKNLVDTQTAINWRQLPGIIRKQIKGHKEGEPSKPISIKTFDDTSFLAASNEPKCIWYGHSVLLMRINQVNILIDPMFGSDASPIAPTKTRRFSENTLSIIDALPEIDIMLITHDHYDHLDLDSMLKLKSKIKKTFVALGVKRHLMQWGYDANHIEEFDWWDSINIHDLDITFTPTRHFSGRGISSIGKCLWGGWAIKSKQHNIWFSGDGGYAEHFKEIGKRLGPFDIGFIECGQYCVDWPQIHMFPEECIQAASDADVKVAMPVHWGGFKLSYQHAWYEPVEHFIQHAQKNNLPFFVPSIGEVFTIGSSTNYWWEEYK